MAFGDSLLEHFNGVELAPDGPIDGVSLAVVTRAIKKGAIPRPHYTRRVPLIWCRRCDADRLDDGRPCPSCGAYERIAGKERR